MCDGEGGASPPRPASQLSSFTCGDTHTGAHAQVPWLGRKG